MQIISSNAWSYSGLVPGLGEILPEKKNVLKVICYFKEGKCGSSGAVGHIVDILLVGLLQTLVMHALIAFKVA